MKTQLPKIIELWWDVEDAAKELLELWEAERQAKKQEAQDAKLAANQKTG